MTAPADNTATGPFHKGEHAIQRRAGVEQTVAGFARSAIRPFMPEQHRQFFTASPFIIASARDQQNRIWATVLARQNPAGGFIQSPDEHSLLIDATPIKGDALELALQPGSSIGLLGIALENRRRNRLNGTLGKSQNGALQVSVDQSFGNCPQYISQRQWQATEQTLTRSAPECRQDLDAELTHWISRADTCFIASGFQQNPERLAAEGMDVSHRGGAPGFINVLSATRLSMPDYAGNNYFNTLGNLILDPRVGLLFLDFETGDMLQITGQANIVWHDSSAASDQTNQRSVEIDITALIRHRSALPIRWSKARSATRELRLLRRTRESESVTSFEFEARDNGPLLPFKAGQHLPLIIPLRSGQSIERNYSLSGSPDSHTYRISVKREALGQVSRWLHDTFHEGSAILTQTPAGDFVLPDNNRDIVLLAAGIGITPLISMLHALVNDPRRASLVYSARHARQRPFAKELKTLKAQGMNITTLFSQPEAQDIHGVDFDHHGRIDLNIIKIHSPDLDAQFYLCGPPSFIDALQAQLLAAGVSGNRIHSEQF